jgi:hypothetical protein
VRVRLFDEGFSPDEVFRHPRHQAAQKVLVERIERLRACAGLRDGYEVQQAALVAWMPSEFLPARDGSNVHHLRP